MSALELLEPHFKLANAKLPGDQRFWEAVLNQSDIFSWTTAAQINYRDGGGIVPKGGPFGAQLWLYRDGEEPILVGTSAHPEDSNAVVSKGLASAHAEAENLSLENREKIINFLEEDGREGWKVVQISSGESCPACRSKQVIFANDLIERGLIKRGDFHVAFKATYDQTKTIADFNDAPYDNTFRAINHLKATGQLTDIEQFGNVIKNDEILMGMEKKGDLIHVPVLYGQLNQSAGENIRQFFADNAGVSASAVISLDGAKTLSAEVDGRAQGDSTNFEENSIVKAIHSASATLRASGKFMGAWDLEKSVLVTTVQDIGPLSMSEALWSNLSNIVILDNPQNSILREREFQGLSNSQLFDVVAAPYNSKNSPIQVTYMGDGQESVSQHLWNLQQSRLSKLLEEQAQRVDALNDKSFRYIDGEEGKLSDFVRHQRPEQSTHYDGTQGDNEISIPKYVTLTR